jgi:hypothetical protein
MAMLNAINKQIYPISNNGKHIPLSISSIVPMFKIRLNEIMNETGSLTQIEERMHDLHQKIVSSITKEEKKALRIRLKALEKQYNTVTEETTNGKVYPVKKVPPQTTKEELYKLIDDVEPTPFERDLNLHGLNTKEDIEGLLDISGISVGKNRFEFVEKGW